jgi:nickel-dependent lactate racemase
MTLYARQAAPPGAVLSDDALTAVLGDGLRGRFTGARVLVLIPDHTRTIPLPLAFRAVCAALHDAASLDFMVALGTHPPLSEAALCALVGLSPTERAGEYAHVGLLNHAWDSPAALATLGTLPRETIAALAGSRWHPSLGGDVPVRINRAAVEADHVLIVGPVFPHEVVGFSGGTKYLFPGISGPELIHVTHWLGALITVLDTIGVAETPMRAVIDAAAALLATPVTLAALVVTAAGSAGAFIGPVHEAWAAAAALSAERHIVWTERTYTQVLSCAPPMYDELWTAAKAMYKLEPAVADGGELIVYAPHLDTVSHVHGAAIAEAGYHVRDYFLKQWDRFGHLPLGVLAHGTHLRGSGTYDDPPGSGERARIRVTLASRIDPETCAALGLGYRDPGSISPAAWRGREREGVLVVEKAGEMLYRPRRRA